jgi:hypothetical protein
MMKTLFAGLLAGLFLAGCASAPQVYQGGPDWTRRSSGVSVGTNGAKVFSGVGIAANIANPSLRRAAADAKARVEISKVFKTYVANMLKQYAASTVADDPNAQSNEQHVEEVSKVVTEATLSGVVVPDHWVSPDNTTEYALAELEADALSKELDKIKQLDAKTRDYIRANAARAFDDLDKELAREKQ